MNSREERAEEGRREGVRGRTASECSWIASVGSLASKPSSKPLSLLCRPAFDERSFNLSRRRCASSLATARWAVEGRWAPFPRPSDCACFDAAAISGLNLSSFVGRGVDGRDGVFEGLMGTSDTSRVLFALLMSSGACCFAMREDAKEYGTVPTLRVVL